MNSSYQYSLKQKKIHGWSRFLFLALSLALIVSVAACSAPTPTTAPAAPAATTAPQQPASSGEGGWSRQYEGTKLNYIGEATLNTTVLKKLLPEFTEKTGIQVNVEEAPYDNLVQKVVLDFSTHQGGYDVLSMPYEYLGSFAEQGYIVPLA